MLLDLPTLFQKTIGNIMAKQRSIGKPNTMGLSKHRKCNHGGPPSGCFTGKSSSNSKKKQKLSVKEKQAKKFTHTNKYDQFSKSEDHKNKWNYEKKKKQ